MSTSTNPQARVTDPITSHQAAASVDGIESTHDRIVYLLEVFGRRSDEALYIDYRSIFGYISPSGLRTRRKELADLGIVRDSGQQTKTASGRSTIMWELVPDRAVRADR